jgi:DNA-directed RNA polymerase subunit RPC12/RpoP
MAMIRFACPGCSNVFTVPDEQAGKSGRCPKCQSRFVIPDPVPTAPAPPPPPPPPALNPNEPVEIHPCPKCSARLSVLAADLGGEIECPNCQKAFKALRADIPLPPDSKP